jgi:tetratricopeptide (TPR) repeat protein
MAGYARKDAMRCRAIALVTALAFAAPASAAAQDAEPSAARSDSSSPPERGEAEAMERFAGAQALFDRGDHRAALAEYQRIYELLEGHPRRYFILFNLGRVYEELHRYDRAVQYYQRYLEEGGEGADGRADVEASLRALERLLGTIAVGVTGPERAEVWMGEWQIGEAPGEIPIPGGRNQIEIRAQGYETVRREIEVAARQRLEVSVTMSELSDFHGVTPILFATSTAIAGVAAAVAIGFGANALALHDDAASCPTRPDCMIDANARRSAIAESALVADVMFGVAGLFAVASVVLVFVTDWGGRPAEAAPTPAVALAPSFSPYGASLGLSAAF